ncbi:uncharacterized protein LOC115880180 [Sitophilus oryzae]|uniref:Uncharacterized protein LOC115880180 n=1 Tax=Sitophilus oryzae TaxID=7048 RepID=A0A6J2XP80_SITOR|nr:uncharacterized protein LOC115880180 [Sitophilus oryzae]
MGIPLNDETTLYNLHFADDEVVVAQDKEDLQFMTTRLLSEYEKWGLSVNMSKTKYLCIGQAAETLHLDGNIEIGSCNKYTYLGTQIDYTGRTESEIEERILKGKKVSGCLNSVLWSKHISYEKKHAIYNSIFKSIVLYGCETWHLTSRMEQRLLALEIDFWRRSAGISRMERIANIEIREIMHVQQAIINEIEKRQLVWYGHVERMSEDRIPKKVLKSISELSSVFGPHSSIHQVSAGIHTIRKEKKGKAESNMDRRNT